MRTHSTRLVRDQHVVWSTDQHGDFDAYVDDQLDLDGSRADAAAAREYGPRDL